MRSRPLLLLLALGVLAAPSDAGAALPDLVADEVERPGLQSEGSGASGRRLLRFDSYVHNLASAGALEVRGTGGANRRMAAVEQRIDGVFTPLPPGGGLLYETTDGHAHWHLRAAARYSLGLRGGGAEVAPGMKVGFCLLDSEVFRQSTTAPRTFRGCQDGNADATTVTMGLTPGYRDLYQQGLPFQWVDVSEVQPGLYDLRAEMDPEDLLREADEVNPPSAVPVVIPGHVASGSTVGDLPPNASTSIALSTQVIGSPAGREIRIIAAPEQGALDVPVGTWVAAASVRYTPRPGASGTDGFTFAAREAGVPFPRSPATATVALAFGDALPEPRIDGPTSVVAGTAIQLTGPGGSRWSVDGVPGGDARVGIVTPEGLFTAPATVPDGARVTISVRTPRDQVAQHVVEVLPAPPQQPAPTPPDPVFVVPVTPGVKAPAPPPGTIARLGVTRVGALVAAAVLPGRSGRLRVSLLRGSRRLSTCSVRVRVGRPHVCRLRVQRGAGHHLRVVATLVPLTGRTVSRGAVVPTGHRHP